MKFIDERKKFRKVQEKREKIETKWIKMKQKITRIMKKGYKNRSGKRRYKDR